MRHHLHHARVKALDVLREQRFLLVVSVAILALAAVSVIAHPSKFSSAEVKFADASQSGLSIIPASCPSDPHRPGECDPPPIVCPDGSAVPTNGVCPSGCPAPGVLVNGQCVQSCQQNSERSSDLSGGAGNNAGCSCPAGFSAVNGQCVLTSCPSGYTLVNGQCTATSCPAGYTLQGSQCFISACPAGFVLQGGQCVSTQCPAGYTFQNGACVVSSCPSGYALQNGNCVQTSCGSAYFCQGNDLYQNVPSSGGGIDGGQCTATFVQTCAYACTSGQCIGPSAPTVALWSVLPVLVRSSERTTITWQAQNVASCTVTGSNGDSWSGLSGHQISRPIIAQTTYTILCQGLSGAIPPSITRSAIVNIVPIFRER